MVLDSSAVIAILLGEADAQLYSEAIAKDPERYISTASWLETHMVMGGRSRAPGHVLADEFFRQIRAEIIPLDAPHMHAALAAWQRYGKGRHPAGLNFGDCCAYATAMLRGDALLFKGSDFSQTDVASVL